MPSTDIAAQLSLIVCVWLRELNCCGGACTFKLVSNLCDSFSKKFKPKKARKKTNQNRTANECARRPTTTTIGDEQTAQKMFAKEEINK